MPASVKIYRYLASKWALKTLGERRLRISRISELNDPFEWWVGAVANNPTHAAFGRETLDDFKVRLDKKFGIICSCAEISDPAMWGHYADKHRGIALEFDHFLGEGLTPVSYCHALPILDFEALVESGFDSNITLSSLKQALGRKATSWAYEKEYRAHFDLTKDVVEEDGHHFTPILENFLKRVILGVRCDTSKSQVMKALAQGGFTDVEVVQARMTDTSYEILCD